MTPQKQLPPTISQNENVDTNLLLEAFKGDQEILLFYVTWIKCGMNATEAYRELHPNVTYGSARELGSRQLARIDKKILMRAYGLDEQKYFKQLTEGLDATKWNDFTGDREADHKTRKAYHDKLGKLLELEEDKSPVTIDQRTLIIKDGSEE
jgi:hypothetical protein